MVHPEDTVYIIDPDEAVHDALTTLLGANGTSVACYSDAESFLNSGLARESTCGVLLVEASLPGMGSLAFLNRLQALGMQQPVVVLTRTSNREIAAQILKAGAVEVIEKPLVGTRLLQLLRGMAAETSEILA
jgi:FixJ family two-component response regulator